MKWTEAQERVIKERNCNLLVSAAAGSGKTAVLVERIIKRLCEDEEKISLDRLLVMTFTKAAAEEMRERIGRAISERIRLEPDNKDLILQKTLLPRAKIATIDSICQNLIKQNYQYLDIDPGFRVPDEAELNIIKEDIMKAFMEECYERADEDFLEFAEIFGGIGLNEKLSELVLANANLLNSNPWPEAVLREELLECEKEKNGEYEDTEWFRFIWEDIKNFTAEYMENLEYARELCYEPEGPLPYLENIDELLNIGEDILGAKTFKELYDILTGIEIGRLKTVRGAKYNAELKDLAKKHIDEFKTYLKEKLIKSYAAVPVEVLSDAIAEAAVNNEILLKLSGEFNKRFEKKKRDKNLVDFSDMEHLALKLLYDEVNGEMVPSKLADTLSEQFDEILIDEYQDSNFVQEALLKALSGERFGRPDIFMVGDVKQSIYRFRLAKPELFMAKYELYKDTGKDVKIELNQNFRSRAEVVSSVNSIFRRIMRAELGGINYDDAQSLKLGAVYPDSDDKETELCIVDVSTDETEANADKDVYEARYIAREIHRMMGKGPYGRREEPFLVTDKISGELRPVCYRDFVILMRAPGKRAEKFARELNYAGIPVYYENAKGYFDAPEIEIILSYLSVIDNPDQDIALTASLRSIIGDFSDSELAYIRSVYNQKLEEELREGGRMYHALRYCSDEWKAGNERERMIKLKCRWFTNRLDTYRRESALIPVHALLYRIYRETGYYECMGAMPLGSVRKRNLDLLLKRAESYSKSSFHGLFSFVRYIERLEKSNSDYGEARVISENDDIVRIVSIHKSKGLEYPVVFLSGVGKQFNRQDQYEMIVADGDMGIASDYFDLEDRVKYPVLKKNAIKRKKEIDDLGEELRVLYVAMTRAKEKLIMTAAISNLESKLKKNSVSFPNEKLPVSVIGSANSYLDWVLMSTSENASDISIRIISKEEMDSYESESELERDSYYRDVQEDIPAELIRDDFVKHIMESLDRKYKYDRYLYLKPKLSVSELKEGAYIIEAAQDEVDEEVIKNKKEIAAIRGNAFHRFMELIDYGNFRKLLAESPSPSDEEILAFLDAEYNRVISEGRMLKEEEERLEPKLALGLFKSELAGELARSDEKGGLKREQRFMIGFKAGEDLKEKVEVFKNAVKNHEELHMDYGEEIQLLQGIADCIYEDDEGRLVIVDYKTDRVRSKDTLIERYLGQLVTYAVAISQISGKEIADCIIYSTALQKAFSVLE